MHRLLLQRRWLRAIALAALFTLACLALAHWQWDRRTGKVAAIHLVQENYDRRPVALDAVLPPGSGALPASLTWTPVTVTGTYLPRATLVVRHRTHGDDGFGYQVLVPLRLADGRVLVVDRGWVPPDTAGSVDDPSAVPAPPGGTVTAVVHLRPAEPVDGRSAPRARSRRSTWPGRWPPGSRPPGPTARPLHRPWSPGPTASW